MNKHVLSLITTLVLALGVTTAGAQTLRAVPVKAENQATTIGQPPAPPIPEACQSMPDGTIQCEQTICEEIGSNLKECITYTFTRDSYDP